MSIIHITQIGNKIIQLLEDKLDLSDINPADPDRKSKVLSRCLAAYAVYALANCSPEEAAQAVVDGEGDNGLDAIYYSSSNSKLYIVQAKWSHEGAGAPDSEAVLKFSKGIKDLFELNFDNFNQKVKARRSLIEVPIQDFNNRYELILIHTGTGSLAAPQTEILNTLVFDLNDASDLVELTVLSQQRVYELVSSDLGRNSINLEIGLSQWGKVEDPHKAYYGSVQGEEVAKWWSTYGDRLLDKNLRFSLGRTDVNEEISSTLTAHPNLFWYFNNGITIVAEKVTKSMAGGNSRDFGTFKAEGASIVNGAQTVSTIGRFLHKSGNTASLDAVKLPLRIISLDETPDNFGISVTKTNNRQNRIESRDFVSQDPEQLRIKLELAHENIEYNLVRSESFKPDDDSFDVVEAATALACASRDANITTSVKREIGKVWDDLTKSPYKALFNPSTTGLYVLRCVKVFREVDGLLKQKTKSLGTRSGRAYGTMIHGNRLIELTVFSWLDKDLFTNPTREFDLDKLKPELNRLLDVSIGRYVQEAETQYKANLLATLFKNIKACQALYSKCVNPKP